MTKTTSRPAGAKGAQEFKLTINAKQAERHAEVAKRRARLAKQQMKAAKKAYKLARRFAKKAAKKSRQRAGELESWLRQNKAAAPKKRVIKQGATVKARKVSRKPRAVRRKAPTPEATPLVQPTSVPPSSPDAIASA
jgi:ATPase subunit of ABC transporter with duplicated ATPase domains